MKWKTWFGSKSSITFRPRIWSKILSCVDPWTQTDSFPSPSSPDSQEFRWVDDPQLGWLYRIADIRRSARCSVWNLSEVSSIHRWVGQKAVCGALNLWNLLFGGPSAKLLPPAALILRLVIALCMLFFSWFRIFLIGAYFYLKIIRLNGLSDYLIARPWLI